MTKNALWLLQHFLQHLGAFSSDFNSLVVAVFVGQFQRGQKFLLHQSLKKYTSSFRGDQVARQVQMNDGRVSLNASCQNLEPIVFNKVFTKIEPAVVALADGFAYYTN